MINSDSIVLPSCEPDKTFWEIFYFKNIRVKNRSNLEISFSTPVL